jgi:cupin fold WbuC family metalloprotein
MKIFSADYLNELTEVAQGNLRMRQHRNIHKSYKESCQRLFNAIEPGSYIRPHRHATDPREELMIAVRGLMVLVSFNEQGMIADFVVFGANKNGDGLAVGVEISANTWHTVIALEPGSVLLEIKAGPFDPSQPKDLASWAPDEGWPTAQKYLEFLILSVKQSKCCDVIKLK